MFVMEKLTKVSKNMMVNRNVTCDVSSASNTCFSLPRILTGVQENDDDDDDEKGDDDCDLFGLEGK
jgi:hypothetical protein